METLLKEFRNEFYKKDDALFDRAGNNVSQQVEDFIAKKLQQAEQEIKRMKKKTREDFYFDIETENRDFIYDYAEKLGYNQAIDDLITNITKEE